MPRLVDGAGRVAIAARMLAMDLLRRRVTLLLLFVVPALFDAIVFATTASRPVDVLVAALGRTSALDNRQLTLVFMGGAAVSFLTCFLGFNLVHKRRDVDARLVLAGFRAHELLTAKLVVLLSLVALLAVYETAMLYLCFAPRHVLGVGCGLLLGGLVYGSLGFAVGAIFTRELEAIFVIVLLTNVDVGWLQNPIYYATSERRGLIENLPGHYPTQLAIVSAFTDEAASSAALHSLACAAAALAAALLAFALRVHLPRRS